MEEMRVKCDLKIDMLKESIENEQHFAKKLKRENEAKTQEMEKLKLEMRYVEQDFEAFRKRTDEVSDRYCQLIEEQTKNKVGLQEFLGLLDPFNNDVVCGKRDIIRNVIGPSITLRVASRFFRKLRQF